MIASNLTPSEYYHVNGTLLPEQIEALLDRWEQTSDMNISPHIQEARCSYPEEDFLVHVIRKVESLGLPKAKVKVIVDMLDEVQDEVTRSTGYGLDELKKADAAVFIP